MARIRTIKPDSRPRNDRGHFKKAAVSADARRVLAIRYGCNAGEVVGAKCAYCDFVGSIHWIVQPGQRGPGWAAFSGLEIDHVLSEFHGGSSGHENLALACRNCNRSKGAKSLSDWRREK